MKPRALSFAEADESGRQFVYFFNSFAIIWMNINGF